MFYDVAKAVVRPILRIVWRPVIEDLENLPTTGGVILTSNHLAIADTWVMPVLLSRRVNFLAKSDYFTRSGPANRALGAFLRGLRVTPLNRSGGSASRAAIATGLEILHRGEVLGIYPEGSRSPDGRLYRGKTGAARLALESGCPIVPVAMVGSFEAQSGRRLLPHRSPRMRVLVGESLDAAALAEASGHTLEGERLRAVTDAVMDSIGALSGQVRADEYVSEAKQRLAAQRTAGAAADAEASGASGRTSRRPGLGRRRR